MTFGHRDEADRRSSDCEPDDLGTNKLSFWRQKIELTVNHEKPYFGVGMTSKPSKIRFSFVDGNPQSESAKRSVRTIVRSNASNRRWRLVRESAAKSRDLGSKVDADENSSLPEVKIKAEDGGPDEVVRKHKQGRRLRLEQKLVRRDSRTSHDGQQADVDNPLKVTNLTQNYFGIMPSSDVSRQSISRMLKGTAASYAQLFPAGKGHKVSGMAKDWFQQCLKTRGILHTALFCQAMRAQAVRPGYNAMPRTEIMLCQTEAFHAINDKLLQSATAIDDDSIRIVFSLAWHGSINEDVPPRSPRQAPMADLQSLRLFMGSIVCDPIHVQGLDNMLALRGGLHKVDMPGLAFLLSYADVMNATCNLTRPTWAYASYTQYVPDAAVDDEYLWSTHRKDHPLATLGNAFSNLHLWLPHERSRQLQLVFTGMADYTRATEDFIHSRPEDRNHALMADQRNSIQHMLMSLSPLEDEYFPDFDLYVLCWLAGVAYSMMIVFPLSPKAAKFERIARLIRAKMLSPAVCEKWSQAPTLVIWVTVLGALCAIGTSDRDWYVRVLQQETEKLKIVSWQGLKAHLMRFLWFPMSNDLDGNDLWREVELIGRLLPRDGREDG